MRVNHSEVSGVPPMSTSHDAGSPTTPSTGPTLVPSATRSISKATLVPLLVDPASTGQAIVKYGYLRQLGLRTGEVAAVQTRLGDASTAGSADPAVPVTDAHLAVFTRFEHPTLAALPQPSVLTDIPVSTLQRFGRGLAEVRTQALAAAPRTTDPATGADQFVAIQPVAQASQQDLNQVLVANTWLDFSTGSSPIGMLNLERLEMTPDGIQRGELVATIPLAPGEQTAVTQKEWSVTSKEFTSIVTDSLENYSETGVTDNTELAQSTTSQIQHANQFNITGTVSGGIPLISGSASSNFAAQDSASKSAVDSTKHATSMTQKASSRTKQEHKVTISTTTVAGSAETTTRTLTNSSATDPMRIDYFSLMRKWRVRLYRYGLRLTYDIVAPEPAATLRRAYRDLETLKASMGPFVFPIPHSAITPDSYLAYAEHYAAQVPPPPDPDSSTMYVPGPVPTASQTGLARYEIPFSVPSGRQVTRITLQGTAAASNGTFNRISVIGTTFSQACSGSDALVIDEQLYGGQSPVQAFMTGATGQQSLLFEFNNIATATLQLYIVLDPSPDVAQQWNSDVWNALYNAAQAQYYANQQDNANRVAVLEDQLANVDTLTLRREENDEIMKSVLRFLLGNQYEFMPDVVRADFVAAGVDVTHGIGFDGNDVKLDTRPWTTVQKYEDIVRFVNQAIEWENVVTFLYSYFWDVPDSWEFVRQLKHPDANRQAFLRAGAARIVLTVRKGWEQAWVEYVEGGYLGASITDHPYLPIAQEIAAYDDRNYPGIPPANPARTATRLEDAVYTTSTATVAMSPDPVSIEVASSDGFITGLPVVIGSVDESPTTQEAPVIVSVPDATHIIVASLTNAHDGTADPFPIMQPGTKGALIAEWAEYTPTSGTDIAVTSNLATIA